MIDIDLKKLKSMAPSELYELSARIRGELIEVIGQTQPRQI